MKVLLILSGLVLAAVICVGSVLAAGWWYLDHTSVMWEGERAFEITSAPTYASYTEPGWGVASIDARPTGATVWSVSGSVGVDDMPAGVAVGDHVTARWWNCSGSTPTSVSGRVLTCGLATDDGGRAPSGTCGSGSGAGPGWSAR